MNDTGVHLQHLNGAATFMCWHAMYLENGYCCKVFKICVAGNFVTIHHIHDSYLKSLGNAFTPCRRCWSWLRHLWGQPGWDRSLTPAQLSNVNASRFQSQDSAIRLSGVEFKYHIHHCTRVVWSRKSHDIGNNLAHHDKHCSLLWDISIDLITNIEYFVVTVFRRVISN